MKRNEIYHKKYLDIENKDLNGNTIVTMGYLSRKLLRYDTKIIVISNPALAGEKSW
jgi:hypothetical protein